MATLIAAGYSAAEIMDPEDKTKHILSTESLTPTDLFGDRQWKNFSKLRNSIGNIKNLKNNLTLKASFIDKIYVAYSGFHDASVAGFNLWARWNKRGFFETDILWNFINRILQKKLKDLYKEHKVKHYEIPEFVCFSHLNHDDLPSLPVLKIISADVDLSTHRIFSHDLTPGARVADAVCASIAIPFVFAPVEIESADANASGRFLDGGLASNLPAWIFAEEKLNFERANPDEGRVPIIAFSLTDAPPPDTAARTKANRDDGTAAFLLKVGRAAVFSGQSIHKQFVDDIVDVPLPTALGVLDFDQPWPDLVAAYRSGEDAANRIIQFELFRKPAFLRQRLKRIEKRFLHLINKSRRRRGASIIRSIRLNIMEKHGNDSLRIIFSINMDQDPDDRVSLDLRSAGAGTAYRKKRLNLTDSRFTEYFFSQKSGFELSARSQKARHAFVTKYERALLRPSLKSIVSVPIFDNVTAWELKSEDRPEPLGVLGIDCDEDLKPDFCARIDRLLAVESPKLKLMKQSEAYLGQTHR